MPDERTKESKHGPTVQKDDGVDLKAGNPSERSRIHAATENQSSVTPDDYPAIDRKEQSALSNPGKPKDG